MTGLPAHTQSSLLPADRRLVRRLIAAGWCAVLVFGLTFPLVDLVFMRVVDDAVVRAAVRWLTLGLAAFVLTDAFTRRTVRMVSDSLTSERHARGEAEALAELTASIAAGKSIEDTLSTAVTAAARIFGDEVRCTILLPSSDGLLRLAAYNNESSARLANVAFRPREGFNGRAFSEGRLIRVEDFQIDAAARPDLRNTPTMRSMIVAPLIAEQRTLGVISAISPVPAAFAEHEEQVLAVVARNVAIALVAAEARESAQREAAKKAAIPTTLWGWWR